MSKKQAATPTAAEQRSRRGVMRALSNIDTEILAELVAAEQDDAAAQDHFAEAFMHRVRAGWALRDKRATTPHGHWRKYVRELADELARRGYPSTGKPYSFRWFEEWIYLAEHLPTEAKAKPVAHLGMKENLRRIRLANKPKPAPLTGDVTGERLRILIGDCRVRMKDLADKSVHMIATSPPYLGQRDYGVKGQIGLEKSIDAYIASLCEAFDEAWRVLRDDGTLWIVIGDSRVTRPPGNNPGTQKAQTGLPNSAENLERRRLNQLSLDKSKIGLRPKNLVGVPHRLALALQKRGWIWRADIIWHKPGVLPEPVTDRPTQCHEHILLFSKQERYCFDAEAVTEPDVSGEKERRGGKGRIPYNGKCAGEPGTGQRSVVSVRADGRRNLRDVWTIPTESSDIGHFAPFPKALVKPMVLAGCPEGGTILDCFAGSGTTGLVANALGRKAVLIDANSEYCAMAKERIEKELPKYTVEANSTDAWGNPIVEVFAEAAE
jgi:DNA modification methylase